MVFVTAGLGGGTGTGAAPIIASLASEMGALTVAVVTKPFAFEGKRRKAQADHGLDELIEFVDTTIVIPNEKLLAVAQNAGFFESFRVADDILRQAVQGISDIITIPGIINRDFADVKTTVIATGFKDEQLGRREHSMGAAAAAISSARAISSYVPAPESTTRERSAPVAVVDSRLQNDHAFAGGVPEPVGVGASPAGSTMSGASRTSVPVRDSISLEAVRNSVNGIDGDDLDVPAFIRKRAEN